MKDIKEFFNNLSKEDIDVYDKLDEMINSGDMPYYIKSFVKEEGIEDKILQYMKEHIKEYEKEILENTKALYELKCIPDANDFSSGLYGINVLYMEAINYALKDKFEEIEFKATCIAQYNSIIIAPKELKHNKEKLVKYIIEHIDDCPIFNLEWLEDSEIPLTIEDLKEK